ncbi:P-type conjugative transfer ATPase TrbB [Sphingobium boeckii]|nr:P-type conjugative transfer ATPase TrbB [Sphingobium boeckii]
MRPTESDDRRRVMLQTAMGSAIAAAMADPLVIEIMVNPDGALRIDRLGEGCSDTGVRLTPAAVERIIRLVASHAKSEVHGASPIVSAELPPHGAGAGERFEGLLPPVSTAPCFAIRKPAARIYRLTDYVADGMMTALDADALARAVRERRNILIAGGTSSGKTTLANALLGEMADLGERVILIEDTRELQCAAPDTVALRTRAGHVCMADLVRSTLRLRPDRIIVGEVRGGEAFDMLKSWNTGHPGGIATVHANSARAALYRLEQLIQENGIVGPRRLIAEAIDRIVFIAGRGLERRIDTIAHVAGLDPQGDFAVIDAVHPPVPPIGETLGTPSRSVEANALEVEPSHRQPAPCQPTSPNQGELI